MEICNAIMDERKKEVADINAYGDSSWAFGRVSLGEATSFWWLNL